MEKGSAQSFLCLRFVISVFFVVFLIPIPVYLVGSCGFRITTKKTLQKKSAAMD